MIDYRPPQITDDHLRRNVAVYIRQSSSDQLRDNVGSAMVQRDAVPGLQKWGWPLSAIEIRDDLGSSADEPGSREEFERMLSDMRAGLLGAIATFAFNRLGRNELDQAIVFYTARIYNVLLIVNGAVYDLRDPNSAFAATMLGGGAVHEHRVKIGLGREARRQKAGAGFEPTGGPVGFDKSRNGPFVKSRDDRVREVIQLIWDTFFRVRSGRGVVRYLNQHAIQVPYRVKGGIGWRDATWDAIAGILKNPAYAGTYVYGKTRIVEEPDHTGLVKKRQVSVPEIDWIVKPDSHPGYVTRAQFAEAQEILAGNWTPRRHAPGRGEALFQGILRCEIHGKKIVTLYDGRHVQQGADGAVLRKPRYTCTPGVGTGTYVPCFSVVALRIEPLFEALMFGRLGPVTIDELRGGFEEELRQYAKVIRAREEDLKRAERSEAELEREYLAPETAEHRHVKDRLRTLWEKARERVGALKTQTLLSPAVPPDQLSEHEADDLRKLLSDLPRLWRLPSLVPQARKTIVRLLVKEIKVAPGKTEVTFTVHWAAGGTDQFSFLNPRGVAAQAQERDDDTRRRLKAKQADREQAYRFIHERFLARDSYRMIVSALVTAGIPPLARVAWTIESVETAVWRMQRRTLFDLPLLPPPPRLRAEVQRLAAELGPDPNAILARARRAGLVTIRRRPPTLQTIRDWLTELGFKGSHPQRVASARRRRSAVEAQKRALRTPTAHGTSAMFMFPDMNDGRPDGR